MNNLEVLKIYVDGLIDVLEYNRLFLNARRKKSKDDKIYINILLIQINVAHQIRTKIQELQEEYKDNE